MFSVIEMRLDVCAVLVEFEVEQYVVSNIYTYLIEKCMSMWKWDDGRVG